MADSRQEKGCTGVFMLMMAGAYLAAYHFGGIDAYVYLGVVVVFLLGVLNLFIAAFSD